MTKVEKNAQLQQIQSWLNRHRVAHITAEAILAARDADWDEAISLDAERVQPGQDAERVQLGQVVKVLDMGSALGIVEAISVGIYSVRGLTGSLWARDRHEIEPVSGVLAAVFETDIEYCSFAHPDLRLALVLILQRRHAKLAAILRARLEYVRHTSDGQVVCWLERHGRAGRPTILAGYEADWDEALAHNDPLYQLLP